MNNTECQDLDEFQRVEYGKCFLCYLDVLGFKELVEKTEPDDLKNALNLLRSNIKILCKKLSVKWLLYSDSLLLYTHDDSIDSFNGLTGIVAAILAMAATQELRFRGAISYGDFSVDEESAIFFGPALLDATRFEKRQEWMGVIITPSCSDFIAKNSTASPLLIEYSVPLKQARRQKQDDKGEIRYENEKLLCIDWTGNYSIDDKIDEPSLRKGFSNDPTKCENTLQFYRHCRQLKH